MYEDEQHDATFDLPGRSPLAAIEAREFVLDVIEGTDQGTSKQLGAARCSIGSHPSNDLVISDRSVSRFHCEIVIDERGAKLRDVGSTNGTFLDGVDVVEGRLRDGSVLRLGEAQIRFRYVGERAPLPVSGARSFGFLVGTSIPMRSAFFLLERAVTTDATVLIQGETGTGKDAAAESIHLAGARRDQPFVVVDCGSIPANLIESELFGHEKGAFTGAIHQRKGAFESASGGTLFLDELGELPSELQPRLLRALEQRTIQRVGASQRIAVNVRVIAATNRNLRARVNDGSFRSDLYFRLAVINIQLPSLRERPEDIPLILGSLLKSLGATPEQMAELTAPAFVQDLQRAAWPGNVRELRNYLEQCLVFRQPPPLATEGNFAPPRTPSEFRALFELPYNVARQQLLGEFEEGYVRNLLERHGGNVSQAAREAGIDRRSVHRILARRRSETT